MRYRFFVPVGAERTSVLVHQGSPLGASLYERQRVTQIGALHLHMRFGAHPSLSALALSGPAPPWHPDLFHNIPSDASLLHGEPGTMSNRSASHGELSLTLEQPSSRWLYLMIYGADVSGDSMPFDLLVRAWDGGWRDLTQPLSSPGLYDRTSGLYEEEITREDTGSEPLERHQILDANWRYWVDPEGPTEYQQEVVAHHLHPSS